MPRSVTSARPAPKLMSADDALARILDGVPRVPAIQTPLLDALGLVLAEDIAADRDVPPFRNSAMDGYAVRGDDVASAPVELRVVGDIAAGGFPDRTVGPGEAMRIMTGAPMPEGADTVVRVEDTDNASDLVTITAATPKGMATRQAGEDLRKGETILTNGTVLRPAEIGLLASVGDHDHLKPVLSELGTIDFWAIAIRPGRPLAFGELKDGDRRVPIFGLPGNTVSALLTFEIFVRPALLRMQGRAHVARPRAKARLLEPADKVASLRVFARGVHDPDAGTVRLTGPQGSGILRSMSLANCLIDLPVGPSRFEAGETVDVILTEQPEAP